LEISEIINLVLLPLGGTSVFLLALATFIGNVNSKRIINGDLAKFKDTHEELKAKHSKELQEIKDNFQLRLENIKAENTLSLEGLKQEYTFQIQSQKMEQESLIEKLKNDLQSRFLKHETYTSISKEKYQELFDKRITMYEDLLLLKKEIDDSIVDNAVYLNFQDEDPRPFTDAIKKINDKSRNSPMLISNELAALTNQLFEKSSTVFSNASINGVLADMNNHGRGNSAESHEAIIDAEDVELRKMFNECSELYDEWFTQLELDVSKIRTTLDLTHLFLSN